MRKTFYFALVKIADYGTTMMNYTLVGNYEFEGNPVAKYLLENNPIIFILITSVVVGLYGAIAIRYQTSHLVQQTLSVIFILNSLVVISNLWIYYVSWGIIRG